MFYIAGVQIHTRSVKSLNQVLTFLIEDIYGGGGWASFFGVRASFLGMDFQVFWRLISFLVVEFILG